MATKKKQKKSSSTPKTGPKREKETERNNPAGFTVRDRRFWARTEEDKTSDGDEKKEKRLPSYVEQLKQKLKDKEEEIAKFGIALRAVREEQKKVAERLERQQATEILNAKVELFQPFLEILDNLERCVQTLDASGQHEEGEPDLKATQNGIRLIQDQFLKALNEAGVEKLDLLNKPFDPDLSEAVAVLDSEDPKADNIVLHEERTGYLLGERLLRPARVVVGRHTEESAKPNASPS